MKTQSETTARCRKKSNPSGRIHPQANARQQHSVSVQTVPVVWPQDPFTFEEHLRVQREIEERAHRFWFAKGSALKNALNDWLKAEAEVLAEFAKSLTQRQQTQPASVEMQTKTGGASALLAAVSCKSTTKLNPKTTAAFQHNL